MGRYVPSLREVVEGTEAASVRRMELLRLLASELVRHPSRRQPRKRLQLSQLARSASPYASSPLSPPSLTPFRAVWTKHARAWNDEAFWRSAFSTGYGLTDGTVTSVAVRLQDIIMVQAGMKKRAVEVVVVSGVGRVRVGWAVGLGLLGWLLA